ncbi:hypothetical protein SLS53_007957 [Cytospora paraplurivora]|uniref:Rhodopsin domain-containing protein n=1 Tax=Cytospora paraplurivora TaxID=2898453 RepID=A0AAN9YC45_9PEZI
MTAICAIIKTTKLDELENLADFSYATVDLVIWAVVEAAVIIIAACMPTLRPFFNKTLAKQENVSENTGFFRWLGSLFTLTSKSSKLPSVEPPRRESGLDSGYQSIRNAPTVKRSVGNESSIAIWCTTETEIKSVPNPQGDGRV